jgi:FHS family glucose/mannose:H+ symporter-like MFS transporter
MFFLGVGVTITGAAARNIGLSPYQIGLLMTALNLGFIISVIISGALADTQEKTVILFVGSGVLAASFLTFYLTDAFLINLTIMFFIGAGTGTYEGVTDAMLLEIHDKRESLHINVNHFFVTIGALMITLYLIFLQMNWRNSSVQSGIVVGTLSLFFLFARAKRGRDTSERLIDRLRFLMKEKVVGILFGATICTVSLEYGTVSILTTYLMEFRGFTQVTSKFALIVLLTGIASGRVVIGFFSKKSRIPFIITLLFGSGTIFFSVLYFTDLSYFTYVFIYFTGMTLSALLPLIITLAGLMYKDFAGTVLGIIKIAIPIGGILFPFLLSMITRFSSFKMSLWLFPLFAAAGFVNLLLNMKKFQQITQQER